MQRRLDGGGLLVARRCQLGRHQGPAESLLDEHGIAHQWLDPAEDDAARAVLAENDALDEERPVVVAPDGRVLVDPGPDDLLRAAGIDRVG